MNFQYSILDSTSVALSIEESQNCCIFAHSREQAPLQPQLCAGMKLSIVTELRQSSCCLEEYCLCKTAGRIAITDDYKLVLLDEGSLYRSLPFVKHRVRGDHHIFSGNLPRNSRRRRGTCVGNRRKSRAIPGQATSILGV